jgi:hypothetical protein
MLIRFSFSSLPLTPGQKRAASFKKMVFIKDVQNEQQGKMRENTTPNRP